MLDSIPFTVVMVVVVVVVDSHYCGLSPASLGVVEKSTSRVFLTSSGSLAPFATFGCVQYFSGVVEGPAALWCGIRL